MLKIKIYANGPLASPEITASGENTREVAIEYLQHIKAAEHLAGLVPKMRLVAKTTGIPSWGILKCKEMQSSAYLFQTMVQRGMAEWLLYSDEEFNPRQAIIRMRQARITHRPHTEAEKKNLSQKRKAYLENLSEDQRKERSASLSAGWAARREKIALGLIIPKKRTGKQNHKKWSEESKKKLSESRKKIYAQMTDEKKKAWATAVSDGMKRRKKKNLDQHRLNRGTIPADKSEIPNWFVIPKDSIFNK